MKKFTFFSNNSRIVSRNQECNVDNGNTMTFQVMLWIGVVFTILSALISFYLKNISARIIVRKEIFSYFPTKIPNIEISHIFAAAWLIVSCVCSVALNYLTQFHTIVVAFIIFLSSSLCASIVSAISVSLFPTNVRAMATCFIFMFGRVGGLSGGNLVGALIETNCSVIFYVYGGLSLGIFFLICHSNERKTINNIIISVCAFVFLLINKETPATNNC